MGKVNVYPHTTGKVKDGNFEHHGYFTKEEGKGTKVKSVMAAGNKVYFDRSRLTEEEMVEIKQSNFIRLARNRMTKTVKSIRALINTANRTAYEWSDEQADKILFTLTNEMTQLENKLRDVREVKENSGYSFDF